MKKSEKQTPRRVPSEPCPDFLARLVKLYGGRRMKVSGTKLLAEEREGEEIHITKRKRVIARLVPAKAQTPRKRPDFLARLEKIYRGRRLKVSGADLIAQERARY